MGTGCTCLSRMYTCVLPIGRPIGIERVLSLSRSGIGWQQVKVVLSVGPYPLMSWVPGNFSRARRICTTESASPPTRSCSIPCNASGASSIIALNREAVSQAVVTLCLCSTAPILLGVGMRSGNRMQRAPCNKAPQTSSVAASNEMGAMCRMVRVASRRA